MYWLKLIRYPNLAIVAFTQFLFYCFIKNVFDKERITAVLDLPHFTLLMVTTICIAASGYIINDILDYKIDLINKPDRMILGKALSIRMAYWFYAITIAVGALIAIYLAFHVQNPGLFFIYPVAIFLLWWYSKTLKAAPLSGNMVVALFAAFVPGIVWFAEREGFAELSSLSGILMRDLFLFYMVFAFLSTLYREIVKDIEDYKGDIDQECRTLAIVLGIEKARWVSYGIATILLVSIIYWVSSQREQLDFRLLSLSVVLLLLPYFVSLYFFIKAKTKNDYHQTSQSIKLMMILGLIYLLLFQLFSTI